MLTKLVAAIIIAVIIAAGLIYLIAKRSATSPQPAAAPAPPSLPTPAAGQTSTPAIASVSKPSSSSLANQLLAQPPAGWKTLRVEEYKLQFSYPTNGWDLMEIDNPTSSPRQLRYVAKLYSDRSGQDDGAHLVIAVYDRNSTSSLTHWVSELVPNLQEIPEGDIYQALAKAYAKGKEIYVRASTPGYSPPPDELVTHKEREENGAMIVELGAIVSGGGRLSYITWLTRKGLNRVYVVELVLEYAQAEATPPTDRQIIDIYDQMLSSMVIND